MTEAVEEVIYYDSEGNPYNSQKVAPKCIKDLSNGYMFIRFEPNTYDFWLDYFVRKSDGAVFWATGPW